MKPKTMSDSDLRLARIFRKIVERGGVSAAEEDLGVGRSTISRQLQDFESRLGLILCERGRSGFRLTHAGEQTLLYVEHLLAAVDDFSTNVAALNAKVEGRLNIGLIDCSFGDPHNPIGRIFKAFHESSPNVALNVSIGSATLLERRVLDGTLHVALLPEYWYNDELAYFQIYEESVGLYAGTDHELFYDSIDKRLDKASVQQFPLIMRNFPEPPALQRRKAGFPRGPSILDTEAVLALVASGSYLGFLPTHLAIARFADLIELLPEEFGYKMPVCLVSRRDRNQSIVLQRLLTVAAGIEK